MHHNLAGRFKNREAVLEAFWKFMEEHNGKRRRNPREFIRVTKVIGNTVHYEVDADVLRAVRAKAFEEGASCST